MKFKVSDICDINKNNIGKNDEYQYIKYLDTSSLTEGRIEALQLLVVGEDKIPSRAKRKVIKNDILISTVRPNQKHYGIIKKVDDNLIASTGFAILSAHEEKVHPEYLYNFLIQANITDFLQSIAETSTSTYPSIKPSVVGNLEIELPSIQEQSGIANILSSLDEKIETNNKINKSLEDMAATIFKHWFVDFEFPNQYGEPYRSSGGKMVESELGIIPKGWEVGRLSDLVEIRYGKDHKKLKDGNVPVYGSGGIMRYVDTALYESESVLVPRKGTLNNVLYTNQPFWSVDTMFYTEMKEKDISKYIYFFLKTKDLASMNTGSAVPSMTTAVLNSMPILIESMEIINSFNKTMSPIFKQISLNTEESNKLSQIRDTLLPKLMSGEIRVPVEE